MDILLRVDSSNIVESLCKENSFYPSNKSYEPEARGGNNTIRNINKTINIFTVTITKLLSIINDIYRIKYLDIKLLIAYSMYSRTTSFAIIQSNFRPRHILLLWDNIG